MLDADRPFWLDPAEGWRYGFPKIFYPATDGAPREWLLRNGLPKSLIKYPSSMWYASEEEIERDMNSKKKES